MLSVSEIARYQLSGLSSPSPGPVRVDSAPAAQAAHVRDERDVRLAILAELALRCLVRDRDWLW
jgi:hypothetical protein